MSEALARQWAEAGYPVFPADPASRKPLVRWGSLTLEESRAELSNWWKRWPTALPVVRTGQISGITIVDVDAHPEKPNGYAALAGCPDDVWRSTPHMVGTPRGGAHFYYGYQGERNGSRQRDLGIDVRGEGGIAFIYGPPPSMPAVDLPPMPTYLTDLLKPKTSDRNDDPDNVVGYHEPILVQDLQPAMGSKLLAEAMQTGTDRSSHAMSVAAGMLAEGYTREVILGVMLHPDNPCAAHCHAEPGDEERRARRIASRCKLSTRLASPEKTFATATAGAAPALPPGASLTPDWDHHLDRDERHKLIQNVDNLTMILANAPIWRGVLQYNTLTLMNELASPIPGWLGADGGPENNQYPRQFKDRDYVAAQVYFQREYGMTKLPKTTVMDAVDSVFELHSYNPVVDYLNSIKWDGMSRLSTWLAAYCGADGNDPLVSAIGRKWMIAAVARQMSPGCKMDNMMVLEGPQGAGKSTALAILAGRDDWFADSLPDVHHKDASQALEGWWIIEMGELSAFRRADMQAFKAFLSRTHEKYRPAYGRNVRNVPRKCVFAGTFNPDADGSASYLSDSTGNRRFWPVRCGSEIDLGGLRRDRDQLWAEAVVAYQSGEPWTLPHELWAAASDAASERMVEDPWLEAVPEIMERLKQTDVFAMTTTLLKYLGVQDAKSFHVTRLKSVMGRLKYSQRYQRIGDKKRRVWQED